MYQDLIDDIELPPMSDCAEFIFQDNALSILLKNGQKFKLFDIEESLSKAEFGHICKLVINKMTKNLKDKININE